ncbi:putative ion transporter superfamily protein YfcC [Virgibacillus natechei]|uniref:Ion transporter superfamily protein YfcC n=1 Tax=Virgibacillus natechei TaxID=1216297 RepID=A0ABS4IIS5_9BACI|nr:AbgT family transporter [Virgibacillus natechei]MBP1970778.1 putative ion transporter superfamily protein YfcC [Virgibacillus natechei]UZD12320.1 AbgT family transporter [Virgibacillus natechei]
MKKKESSSKRRFVMPDAFIIIFSIVFLAAVATYFIPAGTYERETFDNVTQVVPDSYSTVEANPTNLLDLFRSVQLGLVESANIIFLIFTIGGIVAIINSTGSINTGINALIVKTKGRYMLLIMSVSAIFGILATMGVAANAVIAFIPIGIALARSLNLDAIVGVATVYLGYYAGMVAGVFDPTILGLGQSIAELPLFSGITLRIVIFITLLIITITYINFYAKKVKNDPSKSLMGDRLFTDNNDESAGQVKDANFTRKQKLIVSTFFVFIIFFVYGAFNYGWSINELAAIFLIMGVVVALIARITPNQFISTFMDGARSLVYGALVVGVARAVIVVLEQGNILDTIVHGALVPLESTSLFVGGQLLFAFNLLFNLLVTSGTGQAAIIMPLMVPIVDLLGLTRQTGVLILKLGDGFTNIITPTSGVLMAVLAVGGVQWTKWARFVLPLALMWVAVGAIAVGFATLTGYGPF